MKIDRYLDIDWIRKNSKLTHYFGLGFIQVKLDDFNRLHFYTKEFPKTVEKEEIHNHRYNFVSEILQGKLTQEIYEVSDGFTHVSTQESCQAGDDREFPRFPCTINKVFEYTYNDFGKYYIDHRTFHTVDSTDAITHVVRGGYQKEFADVVFPAERTLTCPFSIKVPVEKLYEVIDSMICYV